MGRLLLVIFTSLTLLLSDSSTMTAYEKEIKSLSTSMAVNIADSGKKTIAVVDFTDLQGNVTELGRFLAEEFSVALVASAKGFEVVDRTHLKIIIAEHKLSSTGIIDPRTARKLGQVAGVEALITGTITPFGDSIRLSIKVLDTETAKMIGATTGNIAKTKAIEELLARGIETATPTARRPTTIPSAPPIGGKAVEADGFTLRPVKCIRRGGKLIFTISFLNNGDREKKLRVYGTGVSGRTYLYDNLGHQYQVSVKIGKRKGSIIHQTFIPKLPINVSFISEEFRSDATHVTLALRIDAFKKTIAIRNIPITK